MNHNLGPVRVFFVIDLHALYCILVVENVELAKFKNVVAFRLDEKLLAEGSGTASGDRYTFEALYALRNRGLYGSAAEAPQQVSRSLDEAMDQAVARWRERIEFAERWRREHSIDESGEKKVPPAPAKPRSDVGEGSRPVLILQSSKPSPDEWRRMEEQMEQHTREVWGYGRGKHLEWKRVGRTPGGRDCAVFTVDGAERLYPGPASIETSPPKPVPW